MDTKSNLGKAEAAKQEAKRQKRLEAYRKSRCTDVKTTKAKKNEAKA
jgi:hypothetical protein